MAKSKLLSCARKTQGRLCSAQTLLEETAIMSRIGACESFAHHYPCFPKWIPRWMRSISFSGLPTSNKNGKTAIPWRCHQNMSRVQRANPKKSLLIFEESLEQSMLREARSSVPPAQGCVFFTSVLHGTPGAAAPRDKLSMTLLLPLLCRGLIPNKNEYKGTNVGISIWTSPESHWPHTHTHRLQMPFCGCLLITSFSLVYKARYPSFVSHFPISSILEDWFLYSGGTDVLKSLRQNFQPQCQWCIKFLLP